MTWRLIILWPVDKEPIVVEKTGLIVVAIGFPRSESFTKAREDESFLRFVLGLLFKKGDQ